MKPLERTVYLSSPTMHGEEMEYVQKAYSTNWMSTVGENIDEIERAVAKKVGCQYAVALTCGTAALHLAVKLAGVGEGKTVFCSDLTFAATANPILYEKARPVFIDSEYKTWNMDPEALEEAFCRYPETRLVLVADLYGTPARYDEICEVSEKHGATVISDAAESFGAFYRNRPTASFGKYNVISFNGNKIITGSGGGMLLTNEKKDADAARKWSTQSRENAPWYQHEEVGYNYRMSNVIAGVVRGQIPHLEEHVEQKRKIYHRYREAFKDLPVTMNPFEEKTMTPNFWLSCLLIDRDAMCSQTRGDLTASFVSEKGKSCPTEILEALSRCNAQGRPIWKPMHLQPLYRSAPFVSVNREYGSVGEDIFRRGLCLPSDNKMTEEQQKAIISVVLDCFQ